MSVLISVATISLVTGALQALCLKWQNRTKYPRCPDHLDRACAPTYFNQPFLQVLFMFSGEALCLLFYYGYRLPKKHLYLVRNVEGSDWSSEPIVEDDDEWSEVDVNTPSNVAAIGDQSLETPTTQAASPPTASPVINSSPSPRPKCPWYWWLTPVPFDFLECALGNIAMTITYASTVQMLHNFMVIASAIFSMILMRRPLRIHEWLGCTIVTAALILSGFPAVLKPEPETNASEAHWLGILLAILSTCIHAYQNIWEEALFAKGHINPVKAIGIEGVFGVVLTLALLPLLHLFRVEDFTLGLRQLRDNYGLVVANILYALASFGNNLAGIFITQWTTGLFRCIFMALRPPLIWVIEMMIGWNTFDYFNLVSSMLLLPGLLVHVLVHPLGNLGTISYLLKIPVPCFCTDVENLNDEEEVEHTESTRVPSEKEGAPAPNKTIPALVTTKGEPEYSRELRPVEDGPFLVESP